MRLQRARVAVASVEEDNVVGETSMRVTVWGENIHDRTDERVRAIYPQGMHETIAGALREARSNPARTRPAPSTPPRSAR